jgi:cell division protein FtsQ
LRPDDLFSTRGGAVAEAPEETYASPGAAPRRRARNADPAPRRDFGEDFAGDLPGSSDDSGFDERRGRAAYRLRLPGRVLQLPRTLWGRIFGALGFLAVAACLAAGYLALRSFFLHDPRFTIESSSAIQTVGNTHLTRAQLLSVFGEDVERNIFNVPLAERRAELESLPWVEHATVMRLLPNHLRIAITERTPVAFVRQGSQIGMVDASGVLLDMPTDAPGDPHYSFPVVTGISSDDPLSTRAARMKLYRQFTADLDSNGNRISEKLSEVDLSNPEDVKALIPDNTGGTAADILVHFGDSAFLARYQQYEQHLQEWRTQYPKLASVDMRYERQVVLEMQPGAATTLAPGPQAATPAAAHATIAAAKPASSAQVAAQSPAKSSAPKAVANPSVRPALAKAAPKPAARPAAKSAAKSAAKAAAKPIPPAESAPSNADPAEWHMVVVKPHTKAAAALRPGARTPPQAGPR